MSLLIFIAAELWHRRKGAMADVFLVVIVSAAVTFLSLTSQASLRSIQLITKNMGQNLFLIHDSTRLEDHYHATGRETLFPQERVDTVAAIPRVVTAYHVAILQRRAPFAGREAVLTGALPLKGSLTTADRNNPFVAIEPGTVRLGGEIARETGLVTGSRVTLFGRSFTVDRLEEEKGSLDDLRVYMALADLQQGLGLPGRINAIYSMECLCDGEPLSVTEKRIKNTLETAVPDLKVTTLRQIALARYEAREIMNRYHHVILTFLLFFAAAFMGIQAYVETRRKERETALLSALGFGRGPALGLFVARAALIAGPAPVLGYGLGLAAAVQAGPHFAKAGVTGDPALVFWLTTGTLAVVALVFIPALLHAVRTDPFDVLRQE